MTETEPVRLVEDGDTGDRFLIYGEAGGVSIEVRYSGDALWMTQAQIAELFGRDVSVISRHIAGILEEEELDESNLQKVQIASSTKPVTLYNLDMVISVGYRVSSKQATLFRRWATEKLVQFATKGFVVDVRRLKASREPDRITELREIIRDIRADEANVYRELRQICSLCQDYDGASSACRDFYMQMQAKLLWAVCSKTPAELVRDRADSNFANMGLTNWPNQNIRKSDVSISKSYLGPMEIEELNRLTVILLDIFEDQLKIGKLIVMADAAALLDKQLANLNRSVLRHGGSVSHEQAKAHAEREYDKFKARQKALRHEEADRVIEALRATDADLPTIRKSRSPRR